MRGVFVLEFKVAIGDMPATTVSGDRSQYLCIENSCDQGFKESGVQGTSKNEGTWCGTLAHYDAENSACELATIPRAFKG